MSVGTQKILAVQHIESEDLGTLATSFSMYGVEYNYVMVDEKEDFPSKIGNYSGLVLLGGPISVYDDYPFLKKEENLIRNAIAKEVPVLGICLGSQLLAKTLGGKVCKGKRKEIGWYKIKFENTMNDRVFHDFGSETIVFQWHGDTFDLPPNCTRLALSGLYPNQAFRFGDNVYALQFHLEVTKKTIEEWISKYATELQQLKEFIYTQKILEETPGNIITLSKLSEKFCSRFVRLIGTQ